MTEMQKKQILNMRKRGMGYKTIANELGISRDVVRNFCISRNMAGYGKAATLNTAERIDKGELCLNCYEINKTKARGRHRRFCSDKCRREWWKNHPDKINKKAIYHFECKHCGTRFTAYGNKNRKYCSHECYVNDRFCHKEESN